LDSRVSELDNLRFSYEALLRRKKLAAVVLGKGEYIYIGIYPTRGSQYHLKEPVLMGFFEKYVPMNK
jgi:hypothetical protein